MEVYLTARIKKIIEIAKKQGYIKKLTFKQFFSTPLVIENHLKRLTDLGILKWDPENPERFIYIGTSEK